MKLLQLKLILPIQRSIDDIAEIIEENELSSVELHHSRFRTDGVIAFKAPAIYATIMGRNVTIERSQIPIYGLNDVESLSNPAYALTRIAEIGQKLKDRGIDVTIPGFYESFEKFVGFAKREYQRHEQLAHNTTSTMVPLGVFPV